MCTEGENKPFLKTHCLGVERAAKPTFVERTAEPTAKPPVVEQKSFSGQRVTTPQSCSGLAGTPD